MTDATLARMGHRLKKYLLEGGASTVPIDDDIELCRVLCV